MATENMPAEAPLHIRIAPEEALYWRRPLREGDPAAWLMVLGSLGLGLAAAVRFGSPLTGLVAAAVLFCFAYRAWLPQEVQVGPQGVTVRVWGWPVAPTLRRWTSFVRYEFRSRGVFLTADPPGSPLAPLRGYYVPFGDAREAVVANVEYYLQRWAERSTHAR